MASDSDKTVFMPAAIRPLLPALKRSHAALVYVCLASHAGADDRCYVSGETIAAETGLHDDSVWRALKVLRELGLIDRAAGKRNSRATVLTGSSRWVLSYPMKTGNSSPIKTGTRQNQVPDNIGDEFPDENGVNYPTKTGTKEHHLGTPKKEHQEERAADAAGAPASPPLGAGGLDPEEMIAISAEHSNTSGGGQHAAAHPEAPAARDTRAASTSCAASTDTDDHPKATGGRLTDSDRDAIRSSPVAMAGWLGYGRASLGLEPAAWVALKPQPMNWFVSTFEPTDLQTLYEAPPSPTKQQTAAFAWFCLCVLRSHAGLSLAMPGPHDLLGNKKNARVQGILGGLYEQRGGAAVCEYIRQVAANWAAIQEGTRWLDSPLTLDVGMFRHGAVVKYVEKLQAGFDASAADEDESLVKEWQV